MDQDALNVSLPGFLREFVDAEVAAGGYGSASEYVGELLRRARREKAIDKVDSLLAEALTEPAKEMTDEDWQELRRRSDERIAQRYRDVS
ncbi:MAG: type II toxin-antitoxin system ParD family antitoxin [Planctomycetes bacterium]|nr:type II toxin-antitoxin system ParD family antitoxin [Planctomycetota bacterium]